MKIFSDNPFTSIVLISGGILLVSFFVNYFKEWPKRIILTFEDKIKDRDVNTEYAPTDEYALYGSIRKHKWNSISNPTELRIWGMFSYRRYIVFRNEDHSIVETIELDMAKYEKISHHHLKVKYSQKPKEKNSLPDKKM